MISQKEYICNDLVKEFAGALVGETVGKFSDREGKCFICVSCPEPPNAPRIQIDGPEEEVLEVKNDLDCLLSKGGYKLK